MEEPLDKFDNETIKKDELAIGWKILSFLIPVAGAIIYFNNKNKNEKKAQSACYAALFGIGLNIVLRVITLAISQ